MKKEKQKYEVYRCSRIIDLDNGVAYTSVKREFIGNTYAVSEKQAMNNVRFRQRSSANPNGGYANDIVDCGSMNAKKTWYECKLA